MDWRKVKLLLLLAAMVVAAVFLHRYTPQWQVYKRVVLDNPSPRPVPVAARDTVWLGCTWVETKDGKVIVKYERLANPVLWDSLREVRKTKEAR